MKYRAKMSKRRSKRTFKRTVNKTHKFNVVRAPMHMRGGVRL